MDDSTKKSLERSVTAWIGDLNRGDRDAAREIWQRYFERLVRVADRRLGNASRRMTDAEDVALSVFDLLCRGAEEKRFDRLQNRDDLWALLVAMTGMRAVDHIRREVAQKRGGGATRGDSILEGAATEGAGFDQFLADEPTPEFLAMMDEESARLMERLGDDTQRAIARLRLQGYSNAEIAQQLDVSLRTVERKLELIRLAWSQDLSND